MQRFGIQKMAVAIVAIALAGSADQASAADMAQAGFAYGGWGGPAMVGGYGGFGGPGYYSAGYMGGYMGGYVGGGGWGYNGSCCNNIWAGYCSEKRCCGGGCFAKHRSRALGCGAGPCCQPTCGQGSCGQGNCGQADCCQQAPVCCPAPRPRRHKCCLRRRFCAPACGMTGCADGCCGYDGGAGSMPYEGFDAPATAPQVTPGDAPMPEAIESPAPAPALDSST